MTEVQQPKRLTKDELRNLKQEILGKLDKLQNHPKEITEILNKIKEELDESKDYEICEQQQILQIQEKKLTAIENILNIQQPEQQEKLDKLVILDEQIYNLVKNIRGKNSLEVKNLIKQISIIIGEEGNQNENLLNYFKQSLRRVDNNNNSIFDLIFIYFENQKEKQKTILETLFEIDEDIKNITDVYGNTPIHLAAAYGQVETIRYLKDEEKLDISVRNVYGNTPIHLAVMYGQVEAIRYLKNEEKVDIDVKNNDGDAPLHFAAYYGKVGAVQKLIELKADTNLLDNNNLTPLDIPFYKIINSKNIKNHTNHLQTSILLMQNCVIVNKGRDKNDYYSTTQLFTEEITIGGKQKSIFEHLKTQITKDLKDTQNQENQKQKQTKIENIIKSLLSIADDLVLEKEKAKNLKLSVENIDSALKQVISFIGEIGKEVPGLEGVDKDDNKKTIQVLSEKYKTETEPITLKDSNGGELKIEIKEMIERIAEGLDIELKTTGQEENS